MANNKQSVFGLHAVESLLNNQIDRVIRICVQADRQDQKVLALIKLAKVNGIAVETMTRHHMDELTHGANHQGVVAFCNPMRAYTEKDLPGLLESLSEPAFLLILDGVQDPHNLGACFRSADAAGVHAIIAPKDKSASITPVVSKVASGAAETVPFIQVTNLARTLEMLKELGVWIYGAAGEADQTLFKTDLAGPIAIVMGSEGDGLRRLTRELCDHLVKIPMNGSVSSLNVSVATGVFLFEVVRQRKR